MCKQGVDKAISRQRRSSNGNQPDDAKPVVGYNLATSINNSNDLNRRGIAWELYVSADGRYWRRIDCRKYVAADIPTTSNTLYSPEPYPISAANESDYAPLHVNMSAGTTHNNTTVFLSDVTGSQLRRCGKIVSWEVGSAPSNINTLKFRVEVGRPRSPYRVRVKDDGIYLVSNGTMVIVR